MNIELTEHEAELVAKGLEVVAEQCDDDYETCWKLINLLETLQTNE